MPRRRPHQRGRPVLLDDQVEKTILDAVRAGTPYRYAVAAAGISERTFQRWMARGHEAQLAEDEGQPSDPDDQVFVDFYRRVEQARAQAAVRQVALVARAATGGVVIEETTRKYRDPETGGVVEEKTVRRSPPDWRAGAFLLERTTLEFAKNQQIALTGADGGPLQVETALNVEVFASRIRGELLRGTGDRPAITGEVVDPGAA